MDGNQGIAHDRTSADLQTQKEKFRQLNTYLFLNGRCEEAIAFYREHLGVQVQAMMRFRDSPKSCDPTMVPPISEDKIMHCELRIGDTTFMMSDGCTREPAGFQGFSLALGADDEKQADRLFDQFGAGGQVQMPLNQTFFSPRFGVVQDRFGISWMIVMPKATTGGA